MRNVLFSASKCVTGKPFFLLILGRVEASSILLGEVVGVTSHCGGTWYQSGAEKKTNTPWHLLANGFFGPTLQGIMVHCWILMLLDDEYPVVISISQSHPFCPFANYLYPAKEDTGAVQL
jgi:hypothetical protein